MLTREITIDFKNRNTAWNKSLDGIGMVSANNSSRLLLDYKRNFPDQYWKILNYMFSEKGLELSLIKLELGADIDSSSGTEPCVKRSEEEKADVTRGAGFCLVRDALTIKPDLMVDLLYWGIPAWVAEAKDSKEALYQWYKQTIDALYYTYGIRVTHVTLTQNEKNVEKDQIIYIAKALKEEKDTPYDYSQIQIVAGEGVCNWKIADLMLEDADLMNAVDIVSAHYTSFTSENAKLLQNKYGKKLWFSEGSASMNDARLTAPYQDSKTGIAEINGMLDIASRMTQAMTEGMTMYEVQPVVSSYYDGVSYYQKQLILANEPWNGSFFLDTGFYMTLHFSQFLKRGWQLIPQACYGDGKMGGDGHALVDSTFNYVTAVSPDLKELSTILVNPTKETCFYEIHLNTDENNKVLYIWETSASAQNNSYFQSFFLPKGKLEMGENNSFSLALNPYSMVTISTLERNPEDYVPYRREGMLEEKERKPADYLLKLPYEDSFQMESGKEEAWAQRGYAPLYATDQGGAFELVDSGKEKAKGCLMQKITYANKPVDWGGESRPITCLLDDHWHNYKVCVKVSFSINRKGMDTCNYVGLGIRYVLASKKETGYWCRVSEKGQIDLMRENASVGSGFLSKKEIEALQAGKWFDIEVTAEDEQITCKVGSVSLTYVEEGGLFYSGRVALFSDWEENAFSDLEVEPLEKPYIKRWDNLDSAFSYEGEWKHDTMSSFLNYHRTLSTGEKGAKVRVSFTGKQVALLGISEQAEIAFSLDKKEVGHKALPDTENRQAFFVLNNLKEEEHELELTILKGKIGIDAMEI